MYSNLPHTLPPHTHMHTASCSPSPHTHAHPFVFSLPSHTFTFLRVLPPLTHVHIPSCSPSPHTFTLIVVEVWGSWGRGEGDKYEQGDTQAQPPGPHWATAHPVQDTGLLWGGEWIGEEGRVGQGGGGLGRRSRGEGREEDVRGDCCLTCT